MAALTGVLASALLLAACGEGQRLPDQREVTVSGKLLSDKAAKEVYLTRHRLPDLERIDTDTVYADESGNFACRLRLNAPGVYEIDFGGNQQHLIVVSSDDLHITADGFRQSGTFDVTGSPETSYLMAFHHLQRELFHKQNRLAQRIQLAEGADVQRVYVDFMTEAREEIRQFVAETEGSIVAVYAAEFFTEADYFTLEYDLEYLKGVTEKAAARHPRSEFIQRFHRSVHEYRSTAVGEMAPDFVVPDLAGEEFRLSDLRGKYVFLYFWASWDRASRGGFDDLRQTYGRYQSLGFEIVGVSLDKNRLDWERALEAEELPWRNVSELNFWESEPVKLFHIEAIPSNVLLDREGRIIGRDLHADELAALLQETFGAAL